jgi:hypothetical protein
MLPTVNVICSFILTYGFPMAFAVRELWLLGRDDGHGDGSNRASAAPAPKPLPDCLIPKLGPRVPHDWEREDERELELA